MLKKPKIFLIAILIIILGLFLASPTFAQLSKDVETYGQSIYGSAPQNPQEIVGEIIKVVLSFLAVIFLAVTIYSGIIYMTSTGQKEKLQKAKNTLVFAVIGILIIITAYAITSLIFKIITQSSAPAGSTSLPITFLI